MKTFCISILFTIAMLTTVRGQQTVSGTVFDSETKEPLIGASIIVRATGEGVATDAAGHFTLTTSPEDSLHISYIGYDKKVIIAQASPLAVALTPVANNLGQVMVTANREATLRTESPVAISKLSPAVINETKPVLITELINKVPGVVMLNYNNEQHAMSIRQPMGTSPYFLYLEDGIPLRPMGIFNHNALIEMNVFGISNIEVIKGPASSLYGPEAVGGAINFITHRPTAVPTAKVGVQGDQWGYRRLQYGGGGMIAKNVGVYISGFEARQRDAWQTSSDYDKSSVNASVDFALSRKTQVTATFSQNAYDSDMAGSVDSIAFYSRQYSSTTDFTYRKVYAQRTRLTVSQQWNDQHETMLTLAYRDNYIEQNPNYAIRWTPGSTTASGERNRNSFYSTVAMLQHSMKLGFLNARLLTGGIIDHSPTRYWAYRIDLAAHLRADGRSVERYSIVTEHPDVYLSNYEADLENDALYSQFELNPLERLKITVGARYDRMAFDYVNHLDATSGRKVYDQITPKAGATFELLRDKGMYVNYSQGFSPPGLTSIFRKNINAAAGEPEFYYDLEPARFSNIEIGGWGAFFDNKLYVDAAAYRMTGSQELLSVRQPDNSTDYQSAGRTLHRGIEYGLTYSPTPSWLIRFGGTNAVHRFVDFALSTQTSDGAGNVDGKDMPQSPRWIANGEVTWKPASVSGLRLSLEWQRIGGWYQDQVNRVKYEDKGFLGLRGVSYLNLRAGYAIKGFEFFTHVMNLTDELYAHAATRGNASSARTTFTPAAPRTFVMGVQYTVNRKTQTP